MDIKWLESEELEALASKILERQQPKALVCPQEIDILKLIKVACKNLNYEFAAYPLPKKGELKALGCVDTKNKKLLLDMDMLREAAVCNRWMFVAAHELGHLLLHRRYFENGQTPYDSSEIENGFRQDNQLEWQANRFASELLLPREMVNVVVMASSARLHITRNIGKIYVDGQECNYEILNNIKMDISTIFSVSKAVAEIRLKELNIIIDARPKNSCSKIGDIL